MIPGDYFDRYQPTHSENSGGADPVGASGASAGADGILHPALAEEAPAFSDPAAGPASDPAPTPDPAPDSDGRPSLEGAGNTQPILNGQQLGYTGKPRQSRTVRAILGIVKALAYFAIYFGVTLLIELIVMLIWEAGASEPLSAEQLNSLVDTNSMYIMAAVDLLFLAVIGLIFFLRRKNPLSRRQNLGLVNRPKLGRLALILGIGITAQYTVGMLFGLLQEILPQRFVDSYEQTQTAYSAGGLPAYILSGVILAPIVEELLFRGLISTRLTRAMPAWAALLISATSFGVMHGTLIQGLYAGLLGVLLGVVFFRENSLLASIVLHFGFNLASLPAMIFQQNEALAESAAANALLSMVALICIPGCVVLLITYFFLLKKPPRNPEGPEVNAWLMRE